MTTTTIRRLPDGKWQLTQTHDTLTSLMAALDSLADLGEQVAVELPTVEAWDGVFRVGDEGRTREGRPYTVQCTAGERMWEGHRQPVTALVGEEPSPLYYTAAGFWYKPGQPSRNDLMPPTKRGPANEN